jgi:hypothetical protein
MLTALFLTLSTLKSPLFFATSHLSCSFIFLPSFFFEWCDGNNFILLNIFSLHRYVFRSEFFLVRWLLRHEGANTRIARTLKLVYNMVTTLPIMCDLLVMCNPPCRVQKCKVLSLIFCIDAYFCHIFCKIKFVMYQNHWFFWQFAHFNSLTSTKFWPLQVALHLHLGLVLFSSSFILISLCSLALFLFLLYLDWTLFLFFIFLRYPLSATWAAHVLTRKVIHFWRLSKRIPTKTYFESFFEKPIKPCDYFALAKKKPTDR